MYSGKLVFAQVMDHLPMHTFRQLLHHAHVLKCGPRSWRTKVTTGAFPISRSRAHTHRRHGHPLQTVPSAGLIERPQEKNRVDALR